MQQFAEVPAGEYRIRVHADQRFSQDYQISLSPGQYLGQKLDVEDQLLWSDFKYPRTFIPVATSGIGGDQDAERTPLRRSVERVLDPLTGVGPWKMAIRSSA
jgi:hypothetical protein